MKIQLDTDNKVIRLEAQVTLSEFIDTIERLLPNGAWREFKLETNTSFNWTPNPIIIERDRPRDWYEYPWITYSGTGNVQNFDFTTGVYNIEA